MTRYYHSNYWLTPGIVGYIKNIVFNFFQRRRIKLINLYLKRGRVLDIGAGEGIFGNNLPTDIKAVSIDSPIARIKNPDVKKVDFLKWRSKEKFDAIVFWESLEHVDNPLAYLKRANKFLKNKGLIFIEYPRFNCLESRIFGKYWFHLEIPRHSTHLTDNGLTIILKRSGFTPVKHFSVSAFEYSLWGFSASLLAFFKVELTDKLKKSQNPVIFFALIPFGILAFIAEVFFIILQDSPIGFAIARKK